MTGPSFTWTDRAVQEALGLRHHDASDVEFSGVSTDSRTTREGELYVALVGERFDGHDFVADAVAAGARGAVVSRQVTEAGRVTMYAVDDTLEALGALAGHRRRALPARVVGITGSVGKTTTKDLAAAALASSLRVHVTRGNYNNRIGLPLTLLAAPVDSQVVVAEMGTNEPGEIAMLAAIAEPDVAVVTTIGESHLEKLGSIEGVLREKLDLLRGLAPFGRAVVGDVPPELPKEARRVVPGVRVAGWGEDADADLRPEQIEVDHWGHYGFAWRGSRVSLGIPGRHVVTDALLALAVAEAEGVEPRDAASGISTVRPGGMRGEVRRVGDLTLLMDCYNANPPSVRAALDLLEAHGDAARRVAILGSMLELGPRTAQLHRDVLADALGRGFDLVVATGEFARAARDLDAANRSDVVVHDDPEAAYALSRERLEGSETILLKASRGVALERLESRFREDFGDVAPEGGRAAG